MAPTGTATPMTGLRVTAVLPSTLVALTMSCGLAALGGLLVPSAIGGLRAGG
jgi:hypothetical protein